MGYDKRLNDTMKIVTSALKTEGDQTRSLLNYTRLLIKDSQDKAVKQLTQNGTALAILTSGKPLNSVERAQTLLQQYQNRTSNGATQNPSFLNRMLNKELSTPQLAKQLQSLVPTLKEERSQLQERSEKLLSNIRSTGLGISALEAEINFLRELYDQILSIQDIEKHSALELHHFGLGIQDQVAIMNQQIGSLKEQLEALEKLMTISNSTIVQIDQFENLNYPLVLPKLALQLKGNTKQHQLTFRSNSRPVFQDYMTEFFRPFQSFDHIRIVNVIIPENYYYTIGHPVGFPEILEGEFRGIISGSNQKFKIDIKGKNISNFLIEPKERPRSELKTNLDLNSQNVDRLWRADHPAYRHWMVFYVLANPHMRLNGIKIDDTVELDGAVAYLPSTRPGDQFRFVGRVLGSRITPNGYNVALRAYFFDPRTKAISGDFFVELSEQDFNKVTPIDVSGAGI